MLKFGYHSSITLRKEIDALKKEFRNRERKWEEERKDLVGYGKTEELFHEVIRWGK